MSGFFGNVLGRISSVARRVYHIRDIVASNKAVRQATHGAPVNPKNVTFIPGENVRYRQSPPSARFRGVDAKHIPTERYPVASDTKYVPLD